MISSLLTSVGLGMGAGINAYATLLVFGLLARWQPMWFNDDLAHFFASTPVLIVVGVLYVIEFVADKIPTVDHVWDVIHTFIRPAAGKGQYRRINAHRIVLDRMGKTLNGDTKLSTDYDFFELLRRDGKRAARRFLDAHFDDIGQRSTFDLREEAHAEWA